MCVQVYVTIIEIAKTHNCRSQMLREISLFRNRSNSDIFVILGCHCSVMVEARASGPTDSQYQHFLMNELINRVCE